MDVSTDWFFNWYWDKDNSELIALGASTEPENEKCSETPIRYCPELTSGVINIKEPGEIAYNITQRYPNITLCNDENCSLSAFMWIHRPHHKTEVYDLWFTQYTTPMELTFATFDLQLGTVTTIPIVFTPKINQTLYDCRYFNQCHYYKGTVYCSCGTKIIIAIPVANPNSFTVLKSIIGTPPPVFQWGTITSDGKWISINATQDSYRVISLKTDQWKMQKVLFPVGACQGCKLMNVFYDSDSDDVLAVVGSTQKNQYYIGHISVKSGKLELLLELQIPYAGVHIPVGVVEIGQSEFLLSFSYEEAEQTEFVAIVRFSLAK